MKAAARAVGPLALFVPKKWLSCRAMCCFRRRFWPTVALSTSVTSTVLDASALLAFLNSEPGADIVRGVLHDAIISAVNHSEVLKKTIERNSSAELCGAVIPG